MEVSPVSAPEPKWLTAAHYTSSILVILAVSLSFGVVLHPWLRHKLRRQYIKLTEEPPEQSRKALFSKLLLSYVDGQLQEDGEPVEIENFWRKVWPPRFLVLLIALTNAGFQGYIIYTATQEHLPASDILALVAETLCAGYLVVISLCYIRTKRVAFHAKITWHIWSIASLAFIHWYLETFGTYLTLNYHHVQPPQWEEYSAFGISTLLFVVSASIPLGPGLYQDLTRVYNNAVATKIKEAQVATDFDESSKPQSNVNQEVSACIFSRLCFHFVYPLISKASSMEQVDIDDIPAAYAFFRSQNIIRDSVSANGNNGIRTNKGNTFALLYTILRPEWKAVTLSFIYMLILCPLWYLPHICLQNILHILDEALDHRIAFSFAALFVFSRVVNMLIALQRYNVSELYAMPRIKAHASYLLYQKVLSRSSYARSESTEKGKEQTVQSKADILNLISSDSHALSEIGWTFVGLSTALVELVLGCTYVWVLLGPSGFWGLATLIFTGPPAYYLTKLQYKIYEKRLAVKDEKISLMQEAVQAISMIKMMAAERFWYKRINEVRDREFTKMAQARMVGAASGLLYSASPIVVVVVAFAHYTLILKNTLTASIAFTSIAVFDELRPVVMRLPMSMAQLLQELLSAKRIGAFLRGRDVDYLLDPPLDNLPLPQADKLHIRGTVTWDIAAEDSTKYDQGVSPSVTSDPVNVNPVFQLRDLDIEFPRGKMTLVAGKFGCGKSLLLLALLGEARLVEGKISYLVSNLINPVECESGHFDWTPQKGSVAYVPQTPWLLSQSIRDNVLFGLPMNFERYRAVIHAVGLLPDLEVLEDADLTEIGERGKILSGGQKARVSLARAVYSRASVLLLDDVISAVDAQTSKHIVEHCFKSELMTDRTIIIASHAVEALAPLAGHAIFLDDGKAVWTGTGPDLLESGHMAHLKTDAMDLSAPDIASDENEEVEVGKATSFEIKHSVPKTPKNLIVEEQRAKGAVDMHHWRDLKKLNGGNLFWTGLITLLFLRALAPVAGRRTLELWTSKENSGPMLQASGPVFWVALYSGISLLSAVISSGSSFYCFWGGLRATRRIHSQMLESMLRAKMSFFSKTRAGSIIQRFNQDLNEVVDCSELFGILAEVVVFIILDILLVAVKGGWIFGVVCVILIGGFWKPGQWYRSASRQVRRLESVIPGRINAIYGETVAGTAVIRAFGVQSVFIDDLLRHMNMKINATASRIYVGRWLMVNLRMMDVVIMSTTLFIILTKPDMTGSAAGFVLVFARIITANVNGLLINLREFELKGVSLERTSEYRYLPREDGAVLNPHDPNYSHAGVDIDGRLDAGLENWPSEGKVHVDELRVRYGPDLPDILHDVSFDVDSGQRVGIVGATGGGKSTLAKAFFSFVDVTHGKIEIDGKDIAHVPLGAVRSKLGIIAQDPILLSGSLRLNLDIEGSYTDDQLYDALHQVQLIKRSSSAAGSSSSLSDRTVVEDDSQVNIFANLDSEIKSGGENLSAGQKQLVVLARALLKRHKVLILDEATASIDSATDAEISRVVHEEFRGVTVLIIAHRLRTIMPCNKILVMDKGRLVQQGRPSDLILQEGKFQELCKAAGKDEYHHLLSLAGIASQICEPCSEQTAK